MADIGIKVAKQGKSVTSTDPRDYNFWSKYPILKVDMSGGGTIEVGAGATETLTINHNLGYNPIILFYWGVDSANKKKMARSLIAVAENAVYIQNASSDLDNVTVQFYASAVGAVTFDYYYYLFYDESINA